MEIKKVWKAGNSMVVTVGTDFTSGEFVAVDISPVEIRKVNKDDKSSPDDALVV